MNAGTPPQAQPPQGEPRQAQFGALQAAAWAKSILCFWRYCLQRGTARPQRPFDILDLTPRPNGMRLVPRAVARRGDAMLGFRPRVRFVPCGAASAAEMAHNIRSAGKAAANPMVILANHAWQGLPGRLLAVHYGKLLEGDLEQLAAANKESSSQAWLPAAIDGWGECLSAALHRYRVGLNSSPVVLTDGAELVIDAIAAVARKGFLLLSEDIGHATEKQVRLSRFEDLIESHRRGRMPVNFQLLAAQVQDGGALTWERELSGGRGLLVAVRAGCGSAAALDAATVPLRDGRFADAELLARSARVVAGRLCDADAVLALLRQSRHEPAVFLAACPGIHQKLALLT
jgi:hypothetical protein